MKSSTMWKYRYQLLYIIGLPVAYLISREFYNAKWWEGIIISIVWPFFGAIVAFFAYCAYCFIGSFFPNAKKALKVCLSASAFLLVVSLIIVINLFDSRWFGKPCDLLEVVDGNKLVIYSEGRTIRVILHGTEIPESGKWSDEAKIMVEVFTENSPLRYSTVGEPWNGYQPVIMKTGGKKSLNSRLISYGLAKCPDAANERMMSLQESAKRKQLGVWGGKLWTEER